MFRNGLKSMLRSRNHEGCCCAATFNCMGKGWSGVQMFLLSSCQDLIVEKWVNLTLNKTIRALSNRTENSVQAKQRLIFNNTI